jgi:prepilin-type N-terminal cleavage/methylation domain-containing protein
MRSARGFSLIEVLVAAGVLASGLLALAQVMALASRANVAARAATTATILAAQKMAQLRSAPEADAWDGSDVVDRWGRVTIGEDGEGAVFERRWRIQPLAGSPTALVIEVRVGPAVLASTGAARIETARVVAIARRSTP